MKKKAAIALLVCAANSAFTLSACAASSYDDNTGTIDLTSMTVAGSGITVNDNIIEITEGGDFTVTGENDNGMIHINANDKVKLRLSGMSLKNENGPAIFFENAEKALITVTENTENYIEDSADYGEIDAKAALFSNDDMEIKGNGTLTVTGNYKHAIASDDDIDIENGVLNITSNGTDGIHVNNTFKMIGGTLNITAVSDGIQAEEDVIIDGGTINILQSEEGIESGTTLTVNGGELDITSTDDGFNSGGGLGTGETSVPGGKGGGRPKGMEMTEGMEPPEGMERPEGMEIPEGMERPEGMEPPEGMERPEGMQPPEQPSAAPSDNGNGSGAADGEIPVVIDCSTYINGGTIRIDAEGDGIDSNASIYITGGDIYVDGSQSGGDGAIDGNKLVISGGMLWATGSSGMAMGASEESSQCAFLVNLTDNITQGETVTIKDSSGNVLTEYAANKQFNSIVYSDPALKEGETYTIYVNGEEVQTVEMTSKQVSYGSRGFGGGMMGGGMMGGGHGGRPMGGGAPENMGANTDKRADGNGKQNIKVFMNGEEMSFDTSPVIQNDTTLVPVRAIFEALGMTVEWNDETQEITAVKDDLTIKLKIGSTTASKNGETVTLTTAPVITSDSRTLVPVRFISESCGLDVQWDENTRTVSISG